MEAYKSVSGLWYIAAGGYTPAVLTIEYFLNGVKPLYQDWYGV